METRYYFIYVLVFIIEPVLWHIVLGKVFTRKYEKKYYILSGFILFLIFYIKQMLIFNNVHNDTVSVMSMLLQIVYIYCMVKYLYKTTTVESLISVGVISLVSIVTDSVTFMVLFLILDLTVEEVTTFGMSNIFISFVARALEIIIYLIFIYRIPRKVYKLIVSNKEIIPVFVINLVIDIPILSIYNNSQAANFNIELLQMLYLVSLLVFSITTFYIVFILLKIRKKDDQNSLKISKMEMQLQMYSEISEVTDNLRKLRHDMGTHLGLMKSLCEQKKYEDLSSLINDLYREVQIAEDIIILDNKSVAALLNQKYKIAKEKGIELKSTIMIVNFKMKDVDTCSMLSNILDNAIEATEKCANGYVHLFIGPEEQGYMIKCENSFKDVPLMKKNKFITTKENSSLHGLGIEIIKDIVKKYQGVCRFYYKSNCFYVEVHMP